MTDEAKLHEQSVFWLTRQINSPRSMNVIPLLTNEKKILLNDNYVWDHTVRKPNCAAREHRTTTPMAIDVCEKVQTLSGLQLPEF